MKCRTNDCNSNAAKNQDGYCMACSRYANGCARRSMKRVMGVRSVKGMAKGGRFR